MSTRRESKLGSKNPMFGTHKSPEEKQNLREIAIKNGSKPPITRGQDSYQWKGGKPKCSDCSKLLTSYKGKKCRDCFKKSSKVEVTCACGEIFQKYEKTKKLYCSIKCSAENRKGSKSHRWITDRDLLKKSRSKSYDTAYKYWMLEVKKRDNWECKISNDKCFGRLEAHHILNWVDYPELRYEINNGITLCHAHHPRKRAEEKRLQSEFQALVSVSK